MDVDEADMAIKVIQGLNQHNEQLCQRVQDLERDNRRLREALGWYVGRSAESLMFDGGRRAAEALSGEVGPE